MMMKACDLKSWHKSIAPSEFPDGVLKHMSAELFTTALFPLRDLANVPMWPSSLYRAHVRHEGNPANRHYAVGRLSDAVDMHVKTFEAMLQVMMCADRIASIGGIGIYFDTNTPLFHIDTRPNRLMWMRTREGEYVYRENDRVKFYKILGDQL